MRTLTAPETFNSYLTDESRIFHAAPNTISAIYFPETEADLVMILKRANEKGTPITISGAGTGLTGGRVPLHGGDVISLEKMLCCTNGTEHGITCTDTIVGEVAIEVFGQHHQYVRFAPGVPLFLLNKLLPPRLWYPPNPTEQSALLGSTVATNASGGRSFRYGPTRKYVEGLRVVLADGDVVAIRRGETYATNSVLYFSTESGKKYEIPVPTYRMPETKNAAGLYAKPDMDLIDLFIGSEGILGVVSEVTLRLLPRIPISTGLFFFAAEEDALKAVDEMRELTSVIALEYFDANSLKLIGEHNPSHRRIVAVEYEYDESNEDILDNLARIRERYHVVDDIFDRTAHIHGLRHSVPESINQSVARAGTKKLGTDCAVPRAFFPHMMERYHEAGAAFEAFCKKDDGKDDVYYALFGHIADCHLHFNFIPRTPEQAGEAQRLYADLALTAVRFGGTISAEHGVGKKTIEVDGLTYPYLWAQYGHEGLRQIAEVKHLLDPHGILNPGNMVPHEMVCGQR